MLFLKVEITVTLLDCGKAVQSDYSVAKTLETC